MGARVQFGRAFGSLETRRVRRWMALACATGSERARFVIPACHTIRQR
jgi:hypothetical protein